MQKLSTLGLNVINQLPEFTASAVEHNIDIICVQEHRYQSEQALKYHDTNDGWVFVLVSA